LARSGSTSSYRPIVKECEYPALTPQGGILNFQKRDFSSKGTQHGSEEKTMIAKIADKMTEGTKILMGCCAGIMTLVIVAEVVLRYGFGHSLYFSEELSRLTFVWAGFLATSLALRKGVHASVQLVVDRFSKTSRKLVVAFSQMTVLFFLIVILVAAITVLPHQWNQLTPTMEIRMFWFYLSIPVGVGLMILQLLPQIEKTLRGGEQ
jgi:TRAP-type C4-dicarboxylate transport system permease small subunit